MDPVVLWENIKCGKLISGVSQDVEETSEGEVEPSQCAEVPSQHRGKLSNWLWALLKEKNRQ